MSQGRGSASQAAAAMLALIYLLAQAEYARAATYMVGGSSGWTFNMVSWPKGKQFRAGDTLSKFIFPHPSNYRTFNTILNHLYLIIK